MTAPVLTGPAERLGDYLEPFMVDDAENGSPLGWIAFAFGGMFIDVEDVVRHDDVTDAPGWARVADPENAKAWQLPWLAQLAGQRLDPRLPEATQRALLHPDASKRGTAGAIIAAVQTVLTGDKRVELFERTSGAYQHTVVTFTAETPDPALVVAVLADPHVKPVGHWFTHEVASGWTIGDLETAYSGQTIADLEGDFATIADLEANTP